jgi:hypothetical protein
LEAKIDTLILRLAQFWLAAPAKQTTTGSAPGICSQIQWFRSPKHEDRKQGWLSWPNKFLYSKHFHTSCRCVRQFLACKSNDILTLQTIFAARPLSLPHEWTDPHL